MSVANQQQAFEVAWYRVNGRYPERIKTDANGQPFVIGDQSWNQNHPDKVEYFEPLTRRRAESGR
jgi:hypothetical protein